MTTIPDQPREMWVIKKARTFIRQAGICWLPVNPLEICKQFGWEIFTAYQAAHRAGVSRESVLSGQDSDVYYWCGRYKIIYNEQAYKYRITYSIAHEIGHIILGHLVDFEKTRLSRGGLSDSEYWMLEREADIFAAELLMPMPILHALKADKPESIMLICRVSWTTANLRCIEIRRSCVAGDFDDDHWMQKQFAMHLYRVPVCINSRKRFTGIEKHLPGVMRITRKLLHVETDSNSRFLACPKCGNTRFSEHASYCRLCGMYLYNNCTREEENQGWLECGKINPGDARYCEYCGAQTRLMELGLLMTWDEAHREVAAGIEPETWSIGQVRR